MVLVPCLLTRITFTAQFLAESSGVLNISQEVNTMSQNKSVQNSGQATPPQTTNIKTVVIPVPRPGMTALERSLISNINACDKLSAVYQQAQVSCETSVNTQSQTEQYQAKTIDDLRQAFANLACSFDMVNADLANGKALGMALDCLESDCEKLALIAQAMHLQAKAECEKNSATATAQTGQYQTTAPRRMSLDDIIKQQNQERGLVPLPLEPELLLKRVKDGGYSGQFLADAFISAYRTDTPFPHSLGGLIKLDAEGFRLFHQVLHIRYIPGWNDDRLYRIEQQVNAIVGGAA
jgi:hypothetical protein